MTCFLRLLRQLSHSPLKASAERIRSHTAMKTAYFVLATALAIQLDGPSAIAQTADSGLEDRLLLGVATRVLRDSEFRCVRQFVNPGKLEFRDALTVLQQG